MKKAFVVLCIILVLVLLFFIIFKPLEPRAGGDKAEFEAKIISVDGFWVTAETVNGGAFFLSFRTPLPSEFVFDIRSADVESLSSGDYIEGLYFPSRINGNTVEVRCIEIVPQE